MLRTIDVGRNLTKLSFVEWIGINSTFSQAIRWHRKPLYLGPAKSKLFKVPQRYLIPRPEDVEILRLFNNYRTYKKSLIKFLVNIVDENKVQFDEKVLKKAEEDDYNHCMELNNQWNEEIKLIRDERLEKVEAVEKLRVFEKIAEKKEEEKKYLEKIEAKVRKVKQEAATFITRKNIDQAIEEALANVVNYNVAIDNNGNSYQSDCIEQNTNKETISATN
ncbi:hypothetical protein PV327_006221 [Microctonus hyperodae]|uniref:Small ribosomal subunit protein mS26 n=1 Tax=Microctonus hyperodae TaxID=165561 RepID=A0AA39KI62_MICHY|nr:hypothetical protein PV327_006221 [Microctonus hyperodae]